MRVITAHNVNDAWHQAKRVLSAEGVRRDSRNGPVLEHPDPVSTEYLRPTDRVLFDSTRDANPFFHLMEALWMLAGRNDVEWISQFNKRMMSYSDDGKTYHAAYGYRWRHHFDNDTQIEETDQLKKVINILREDKDNRRAVVQMWDPRADLWSPEEIQRRGSVPKDLPCNTSIYFKIRDGKLMMTVANRSNDIVWGCYGANVVHMSMLHEYVAGMIGCPLGSYHQISDSWHAYLDVWNKQNLSDTPVEDPYRSRSMCWPYPIVTHPESFDKDLETFMAGPQLSALGYVSPFFSEIATPMLGAWYCYKAGDFVGAQRLIARMPDGVDWQWAARFWLHRKERDTKAAKVGA